MQETTFKVRDNCVLLKNIPRNWFLSKQVNLQEYKKNCGNNNIYALRNNNGLFYLERLFDSIRAKKSDDTKTVSYIELPKMDFLEKIIRVVIAS